MLACSLSCCMCTRNSSLTERFGWYWYNGRYLCCCYYYNVTIRERLVISWNDYRFVVWKQWHFKVRICFYAGFKKLLLFLHRMQIFQTWMYKIERLNPYLDTQINSLIFKGTEYPKAKILLSVHKSITAANA